MKLMEFEGETVWQRSVHDECICCDGPHVFSRSLDIDPASTDAELVASWTHDGKARVNDMIYKAIFGAPEGARLRITVEQVEP